MASETFPDAEKDLVEPGACFSQEVLDIRFEIAVVDDRDQDPGIIVDQRPPEFLNGADPRLPVAGLGLDLRQALAKQLSPTRRNLADTTDFALHADALAGAIGLPGKLLPLRGPL